MKKKTFALAITLGLFLLSGLAQAQTYECRVGSLTFYSSVPCSNITGPPVPTRPEKEERIKALEQARKALEEILKLRTVVGAVTYPEYERRFLDAKVAFESHLRPVTGLVPGSVLTPLREAVSLYEEAKTLWNTGIHDKKNYLSSMPPFPSGEKEKALIRLYETRFPALTEVIKRFGGYILLEYRYIIAALWQEAHSRLAEAERALERESK